MPDEGEYCPTDCVGDCLKCEDFVCEENDEPEFPQGSNQGYYPG